MASSEEGSPSSELSYQLFKSAIESCHGDQSLALSIQSSSMKPLLNTGDRVKVRSARQIKPRWGDVVVIDEGQSLLTHRLFGTWRGSCLTRGDAAPSIDRRWPPSALLAVVVSAETQTRGHLTQPALRQFFPVCYSWLLFVKGKVLRKR